MPDSEAELETGWAAGVDARNAAGQSPSLISLTVFGFSHNVANGFSYVMILMICGPKFALNLMFSQ
jgi:hypothetical protein